MAKKVIRTSQKESYALEEIRRAKEEYEKDSEMAEKVFISIEELNKAFWSEHTVRIYEFAKEMRKKLKYAEWLVEKYPNTYEYVRYSAERAEERARSDYEQLRELFS